MCPPQTRLVASPALLHTEHVALVRQQVFVFTLLVALDLVAGSWYQALLLRVQLVAGSPAKGMCFLTMSAQLTA
jgi:hypothetical protein